MKKLHWDYFLGLEEDLIRSGRYVELDSVNYRVFSTEFTRLLLAACSEFETVAKQLCRLINPSEPVSRKTIKYYKKTILTAFPKFSTFKIEIPAYSLTIDPWIDWRKKKNPIASPFWWEDYNAVKHNRAKAFEKANLENAINALGALFTVCLYYYRNTDGLRVRFSGMPKLFNLMLAPDFGDEGLWGTFPTYALPDDSQVRVLKPNEDGRKKKK